MSPHRYDASGELEALTKRTSETFALPRGLTLRLPRCGYKRRGHFHRRLAQQLSRLRASKTQPVSPARHSPAATLAPPGNCGGVAILPLQPDRIPLV